MDSSREEAKRIVANNKDIHSSYDKLIEASQARWRVFKHVPNTKEVLAIKAKACAQEMVHNVAVFSQQILSGFGQEDLEIPEHLNVVDIALELTYLQMRFVFVHSHSLLNDNDADDFFWDVINEFSIQMTADEGTEDAFSIFRSSFVDTCKKRLKEYHEEDQKSDDSGKTLEPNAYLAAQHVFDRLSGREHFDVLYAFSAISVWTLALNPGELIDPGEIYLPFEES